MNSLRNSTLPDRIRNEEILYRAINPIQWNTIDNKLTSAVFKDTNGVSVDRMGDRTEGDIIRVYNRRFSRKWGLLNISAANCRIIGTEPTAKPKFNPFHALILNNTGSKNIPKPKAKRLRDVSNIIKEPIYS